jgi:hypothetical protein
LTCHGLIFNLIPPADRRQEPEVHSEVPSDATSPAVADEAEEAPEAEPVEPVEDGLPILPVRSVIKDNQPEKKMAQQKSPDFLLP